MDMIERVARALCRQYEIEDGFSVEQAERAAKSEMYRNFRTAARAAIAAMREPTDEQRNAYYALSGNTEVMMDAHWERAIDAALAPEKVT